MTVKELIRELRNLPEDGVVVFRNDDIWNNGFYEVTEAVDMEDGRVFLESDHEKNYGDV